MHNSGDPELETAALRLYLDESGGNDPGTPHAVVGGILIARTRFLAFEDAWDQMLDEHGITSPLHMKEFGRPHGRLAKISDCCRRELFLEVVDLISSYRVGTISASLGNEEYKQRVPAEVIKAFSMYGMCFVLAAFVTQVLAAANSYDGRIPIIMDSGNPYAGHVRESHATIQQIQREVGQFLSIGSLTFDDDMELGILQAADVISWGARRRATNLPLRAGLEPIERIFTDPTRHKEAPWMPAWLTELGENLARKILS